MAKLLDQRGASTHHRIPLVGRVKTMDDHIDCQANIHDRLARGHGHPYVPRNDCPGILTELGLDESLARFFPGFSPVNQAAIPPVYQVR